MALGDFLGGAATGFQTGLNTVSEMQYRQGLAQLEQQRMAQYQQNADRNFYLKIADDWMGHLENSFQQHVDAAAIAHPETPVETIIKEERQRLQSSGMTAQLQGIQQMYQKLGLDPSIPQARYTDILSSVVPSTAKERAMAQARDPYKSEVEALNIQEKQANIEALNRQKKLETLDVSTTGPNPDSPGPSTPDQLGGPTNPQTGLPTRTAQAAPAAPDPSQSLLNRIPPEARTGVQGLANYEINPNTYSNRIPRGMDKSPRQIMVDLASEYAKARGETYDQKEFPARQKLYNTFMGGQEGKQTRSYNVLVDHLDLLNEGIDALETSVKTGDYRLFNRIAVSIAQSTGNPAPASFDAIKEIVGDELVKAVTGGAAALGDRQAVKDKVDAAQSPTVLRKVVNDYIRLGGGQLKGLEKEYQTGGRKDFQQRFLTDRTRKLFIQSDQSQTSGTIGGVRYSIEP